MIIEVEASPEDDSSPDKRRSRPQNGRNVTLTVTEPQLEESAEGDSSPDNRRSRSTTRRNVSLSLPGTDPEIEASAETDSTLNNRRSRSVNRRHVSLSLPDTDLDDDDDHRFHERSPLLGTGPRFQRQLSSTSRRRAESATRRRAESETRRRSESVTRAKPQSLCGLSRTQKVTLAITCFTDLLAYLSVSVMAPFFPEEALKKDVSSTLSGWIFGVSPFIQFLISPVIGKLCPYVGVNFMFISGVFVFSSCTVLFGFLSFVPTDSGNGIFVLLAFSIQILKSIGITASTTASFVMCAQLFPDNIATALASGEIFVGLGLVTGPALGGVLYGLDGFYLPFLTIGGLGMLSVPIIMCVIPREIAFEDNGDTRLSLAQVFCSPKGIITSITIVVSTSMWSILDPTLEPHLRQYQLRPEVIGLIFLVMAATYALTAPLWGWISDKLDEQRGLLILGFLFATLGSLLVGPSSFLGLGPKYNQLWLVIVALVILGASSSLSAMPTFDLYFSIAEEKGCEDDTRTYSMVAGLWLSMYSLGDFLGPSVGGALLDTVGFEAMCTYSAGLCLFMACILFISWLTDSKCCKGENSSGFWSVNVNDDYEALAGSNCYITGETVTDFTNSI